MDCCCCFSEEGEHQVAQEVRRRTGAWPSGYRPCESEVAPKGGVAGSTEEEAVRTGAWPTGFRPGSEKEQQAAEETHRRTGAWPTGWRGARGGPDDAPEEDLKDDGSFEARKKWRSGVQTVIATNRFAVPKWSMPLDDASDRQFARQARSRTLSRQLTPRSPVPRSDSPRSPANQRRGAWPTGYKASDRVRWENGNEQEPEILSAIDDAVSKWKSVSSAVKMNTVAKMLRPDSKVIADGVDDTPENSRKGAWPTGFRPGSEEEKQAAEETRRRTGAWPTGYKPRRSAGDMVEGAEEEGEREAEGHIESNGLAGITDDMLEAEATRRRVGHWPMGCRRLTTSEEATLVNSSDETLDGELESRKLPTRVGSWPTGHRAAAQISKGAAVSHDDMEAISPASPRPGESPRHRPQAVTIDTAPDTDTGPPKAAVLLLQPATPARPDDTRPVSVEESWRTPKRFSRGGSSVVAQLGPPPSFSPQVTIHSERSGV